MIKGWLWTRWFRHTEVMEVLLSECAIEGRDRGSVASHRGYVIGDRGSVDA
jgi:hypothetical protein